jgi:membrane protein
MSFTLILSGPLAEEMADGLDIAASGILVYRIVRWPVLFFAATLLFSVLYFYAPDVRQPGFRCISVGSISGVAGWMLATVVYDLYATRVVDYGQMYGSLGGVIVFLLWLWILNIALLAGAEINAQLLRKRGHEGRAAAQAGGWEAAGGEGRQTAGGESGRIDAHEGAQRDAHEGAQRNAHEGGQRDAMRREGEGGDRQ